MVLTFLKCYVYAQNLFNKVYQILEKEKYISHTITRLTLFTRAFCHTRVENLLKGPAII